MAKKPSLKITCPHCNKTIPLDEAIKNQIEEDIADKLNKKHQQNLKKVQQNAKKQAESSMSTEIKDLKAQIKEKDEQLSEAEEEELKVRQQKRELEEDKKKIELKFQRKIDEERSKIEEETAKKISEEQELKGKEKDEKIAKLTKTITELKRQAEQGSQKTQGQVLEQNLEQLLKNNFNNDHVESISSGVKGADILQKVYSRQGKLCGTILIESKNSKNWNGNWISKLKEDQREKKADVGMIISTVMPEGVENFSWQDGIMVVKYPYALPIMRLLRERLSELQRVKSSSRGINQKINSLHDYLTGTEFKQSVESIVEALVQMQDDLQKEKRAMTRIWSKREKQIEQAGKGMINAYGSIQGILGDSMPKIKRLEMHGILPEDSDLEDTSD